ncbi:hypothetical protein PAECIP112173_03640 [Paenibacillus sp. JJ-100]|uniref:hypothetical protein n=1 Tax=Paenibacillus sp. JJ-100 TaxID=2974896 RepID=UPI0022FF86C7|nr:hypothetical protein [Paenibacillus sp. JJ-100]CAI6082643.1 hypothetical protein PAECIP112173_03640 [Paenibacillus sp. JJ-100]
MEKKFENVVDGILDNFFVHFTTEIFLLNIIGGIGLILLGFVLLKSRASEGKKVFGWIALTVGCLGMLSGVAQFLGYFMS